MVASLHILSVESAQRITVRLSRPKSAFVRPNSYPLIGLLDAMAENEFGPETSGDAVDAVWGYLDVVGDLKLQSLTSVRPASEWAKHGYTGIYALPHARAISVSVHIGDVVLNDGQMRWLLSERYESSGDFDPVLVRQALNHLRRGMAKVATGQVAILWLRED